LLEIPASVSRAQGDIHVYGNPHLHTDPINAIIIGRNIAAGLARVAPRDSGTFAERAKDFERRILVALYGEDLVRILTPEVLFRLARERTEWDFFQRNRYQGEPLAARLGGWAKQAAPFRGREMVCYHKEWVYFSARFGIPCVEFLEPKPGIPPSPRHVQRVVELMQVRHIPVVFSPNYFDQRQVRQIAQRTGATPVIVPGQVEGAPGVATYFDLVDTWVHELAAVFTAASGTG
jgi:ABC-type Zn uptake system ZnuABC Zn-binding protein ZnuA